MVLRERLAQVVAEFLGTAVLVIAVYSIAARTSFPLFSAIAAAMAVGIGILTVGATSGGHFNPAVTFGLWTIRKVRTMPAILNIAAQFLGAYAALALLKYFLGHSLESLAAKNFEWKVFWAELIGTAVFVFGIAAAIYQRYEGGRLATAIAGSLLIAILVASMASNGVLNPAVAYGMQSWNMTYAIAPLVGGLIGANLYSLLFAADFPTVRIVSASDLSRSKNTIVRSSSSSHKKIVKGNKKSR